MIDTTDGRRNARTIYRTCRPRLGCGAVDDAGSPVEGALGYPREWLDLWEADLTITPETIDDSIGYAAEYEGRIVGFWIRAAMDCDRPTPGWLFVDPDHMGQGIGRALWAAVRQEAAARGLPVS